MSQVEMLNLIMCNVTAWYVNCIEEADGYSAFHALQTCERIENRSAHSITCFTVRITYWICYKHIYAFCEYKQLYLLNLPKTKAVWHGEKKNRNFTIRNLNQRFNFVVSFFVIENVCSKWTLVVALTLFPSIQNHSTALSQKVIRFYGK